MIDEKKLIESLKTDFYEHYSLNHSTNEENLFEMFIDNINKQPKVGEWILINTLNSDGYEQIGLTQSFYFNKMCALCIRL